MDTPHRSPDKSVLRNKAAIYGEYRVSFVVTLRPSGRSFEIEEGASILTTALDQHINLPYGCRLGTCCSCRGKVISGSVDFGNAHPAYLPQSQRDQGYALLCSATPLLIKMGTKKIGLRQRSWLLIRAPAHVTT